MCGVDRGASVRMCKTCARFGRRGGGEAARASASRLAPHLRAGGAEADGTGEEEPAIAADRVAQRIHATQLDGALGVVADRTVAAPARGLRARQHLL